MSKNIAVKLIILLVVAALVYSVLWFFKIGQVEKQVNNFISENSLNVSAGSVAVSGFPMSQKITISDLKFTLPSTLLNKRQVVIKQLEAKAGVFATDFSITFTDATLHDSDGNIANVEFSKDPEIAISFVDGRISKFHYQDFGYRILDQEKNVIYAASSSLISLQSSAAEGEKITTKLTADVKDIEGFDVLDVYKNVFEKKVMEGMKTGEIAIGSISTAASAAQPETASQAAAQIAAAVIATIPAPPAVPTPESIASAAATPADGSAAAPTANPADGMAAAVSNTNLVKSNFIADIEYTLVPNQAEQQAQIPTDPTQIQEAPVQFSKVVKINNAEFSNPIYKASFNGEMSTFQDDSLPSGAISVKIEKVDSLIGYISAGFNQMAEQKRPITTEAVQSSDLANNGMPAEDSYQNFLRKVSANLSSVAKELAAKNAVSKDEIAAFDIRREKNLEFLVNEVSLREVLGKF